MNHYFSSPIRLSVAAPAYNEGQGLEALLVHWYEFLSKQKSIADFEIVICNDGSTDHSKIILDELSLLYPEIRVIHFARNQGAAAAISAAIAATRFEWVLLMDSDDQFPIENLTVMLRQLNHTNATAVLGVRQKKDSAFARFGSRASALLCNVVHGSRLKDFNSACKLVKGRYLRALKLEARGMNYSTEITSKLLESKLSITEIDIEHRSRNMGKSNMRWCRDSIHRFLFVGYISLRQLLLKLNIIRRTLEIENVI